MMDQISLVNQPYDFSWIWVYLEDKDSNIESTNSLAVSFTSEISNRSYESNFSYNDLDSSSMPAEIPSYVQGYSSTSNRKNYTV